MTNTTAIPILFVGVFLFILFLVFKTARKQAELGRQVRQRLGFISVEPVDPTLVERLSRILDPKGGRVRVSRVFKRDQGSYALYDCRVQHGRNDNSPDQTSAIVGRGWQLPSLRLAPRLGGEGKGWKLLNRLTLLALKQGGLQEVVLDGSAEFTKKYVALSNSPQDTARQMPREIWSELAAFPERLYLQAEGDTVIFSTFETPNGRARGDFEMVETDRLKRAIETASRLNSIFECCRKGVVDQSVMS